MTKFGFLARKASSAETPPEPTLASENPIEPDEESFSALGAQFGGENESLRNMLLDANNKINELDTIKAAVRKLVDPVSKTLRDFEAEKAEKAEKVGLQSVLSNTRTAYDKLRNEVGNLEKKLTVSERDCKALRQDLAVAQTQLRTLEAARAEITVDVTARRAQVADLEARLAQQTGEAHALREENRRFDERLIAANKRVIALDSDLNAARQRLTLADDEKRAQQTLLGKASAESARLTRKLAETEASFNAMQGRVRRVEANFADATSERARLVTALEETNERHERERGNQNMRFDLLQARAAALEKVVAEARELLLSRAELIRD
jgi:crescentin